MYENFAKIRDKRGLSDYQIAKDIGISRSIFSDWKSGRHKPSKKNRAKICQYLGFPPVDLFYTDDETAYLVELNRTDSSLEKRVLAYTVRLASGKIIQLSAQDYNELKRALDAFTETWLKTKNLTE